MSSEINNNVSNESKNNISSFQANVPPLIPLTKPIRSWYSFTESDKALLRKSWQPILKDLEGFGIEIYEMIFKQVLKKF